MVGFFSNLIGSFKMDIRCDLSRNVYFPGNVVEGVVIVQARGPVDFRAIRLKLSGKQRTTIARTHTTTHTKADGTTETRQHTEYHHSTAVVYKQLVTLAGNMKYQPFGNGQNTYPMPMGTFYYPFSVQLPTDLPPSMSKHYGKNHSEIFFCAKAYVDIPHGRDAVSKTFFTIIRPMPVSQWHAKAPVESSRQFHVTCCCCIDKGYVSARIFMDRSVIAIDRDNVMIYAEVDNTLGKEPVKALVVTLRAVMNSSAGCHRENHAWVQGRATINNQILPGAKGVLQGVINLTRNAVPTFSSPFCQVSYSINAELEIPMASNPSASFPVLVAQSVDESNFSPAIQFGTSNYRVFPKGGSCPEFYYQPPQQPVYQVNMIPCMPPPPPQFFMPPPQIAIGVPNSEWARNAAPFVPANANKDHVNTLGSGPSIQFGAGVNQAEMKITVKEQPPILGSGAPPMTGQENSNTKGYGAIEEPLV